MARPLRASAAIAALLFALFLLWRLFGGGSAVPALAITFCEAAVFFTTPVLGALPDLCFVAVQRFNRPAILRLVRREKRMHP